MPLYRDYRDYRGYRDCRDYRAWRDPSHTDPVGHQNLTASRKPGYFPAKPRQMDLSGHRSSAYTKSGWLPTYVFKTPRVQSSHPMSNHGRTT